MRILGIFRVFFRYFRGILGKLRESRIPGRGVFFRYFSWKFRVGPFRGSVAGRGVLNQSQQHRFTTGMNPCRSSENPCRTFSETPAKDSQNPSEKQFSSESPWKGCAPRTSQNGRLEMLGYMGFIWRSFQPLQKGRKADNRQILVETPVSGKPQTHLLCQENHRHTCKETKTWLMNKIRITISVATLLQDKLGVFLTKVREV